MKSQEMRKIDHLRSTEFVRRFRHMIFLASVAIAIAGCATGKSALIGVYSNGMSELRESSIVLSSSGYGMFLIAVGGVAGPWDVLHSKGSRYVHMHWVEGTSSELHESDALFAFDKKSRSLEFVGLGNNLEEALAKAHALPVDRPFNQGKNYHYVTNAIPPEYEKILADFPANLERMKRRAENWKRQKEEEAARAKREQPIYDACLAEIKADPRKILTIPFVFYQEGEEPKSLEGRAKMTPELRAIMSALGDKSITFPEDVLMSFLDRYEWESYFYVIGPVFTRDELTAESRRKLHPRMRDYAERLDGERAGTFYEHENTPIDLVRDAYDWKGTGWFREALDRRLKKESDPSKSADGDQGPR